jgi:hypothetical protein
MALISCISLFFFANTRNPPRAAARAARATKTRRGMPPGRWRSFWRSFGEYRFLEDSRYTSQAENRASIKSINQHRKSAFPVAPP